jgi:hypothetical protein
LRNLNAATTDQFGKSDCDAANNYIVAGKNTSWPRYFRHPEGKRDRPNSALFRPENTFSSEIIGRREINRRRPGSPQIGGDF